MSEPPRGWDPDTDSLQDLVRAMFLDQSAEPDAPLRPTSEPPPTPAATSPPGRPPPAGREQAQGSAPRPSHRATGLLTGRYAAPALAAAALITACLAGGQILAASAAPTPTIAPAGPTGIPTPARGSAASSQAAAAPVAPPPSAAPAPVVLTFGKGSALPDGWSLAASRPYLCDVLMAIPVLQKDGTRIMRVTLTLTNRTGAPQATRGWRLAATADGTTAELVLWPAERFRGVPDMTLNTGRSVGFLVAIRVPEHPVELRITAERDAAPRAILAGTL